MVRLEELPDDASPSSGTQPAAGPKVTLPERPPSKPSTASQPQNGIPSSMLDQIPPFPFKDLPPNPLTEPGAAMPPAMASTKQYTADELLTILNRTPLFMTELDETDGAGGENTELEALKALAYDGTRAEIAGNFREQGNEMAQAKRWDHAKAYYDKALGALRMEQREPAEGRLDGGEGPADVDWLENGRPAIVDLDEEERKERQIEEACYVNRALCNLEMKNYGSCNRDCAEAIKLNPRNVKAYYRSGQACLALDKIEAASDACAHALAVEPHNKAVNLLTTRIETRKAFLEKQERARLARLQKQQKEVATLKKALAARNISVGSSKQVPPDVQDAKLQLADPLDAESILSIPTLLLYPTHAQSDVIKAFQEVDTVAEHLEYIFPCPWDTEGEFAMDSVDCYMDTVAGGMVKLGKKVVIGTVLAGGKVQLTDGICKIYVVPKRKTADWIAEVKRRRTG